MADGVEAAGPHAAICNPNWSAFIGQATTSQFGPRLAFGLTGEPAGPVLVKLNGQIIDSAASNGAPVWRYDAAGNALVFEPLFVPQQGEALTVTYTAACH